MQFCFQVRPVWAIRVGCLLGILLCSHSVQAQGLSLEQAVEEAVKANPALAAQYQQAAAMEHMPSQLQALPDPRLSVNLQNVPLDSMDLEQEAMTQLQLGFHQVLPSPGSLSLKGRAASERAEASRLQADELRLRLIAKVKRLWWQLFYLDKALQANVQNRNLVEQFSELARTRYEVGRAQQQDMLLAQLELGKLQDEALRLTGQREQQVAALNKLLDRASHQAIELREREQGAWPQLSGMVELREQARKQRPLLLQTRKQLDAAQSQLAFSREDAGPDFRLGAVYGLRSGDNPDGSARSDFLSLQFSMSLPLYAGSKQNRAIDQRGAELEQFKLQLHEQHNRVATEIQQALAGYRQARKQVELFTREVLPQARQSVDALMAGYQVGKVDFISLQRSQSMLYDYQTRYWQAYSKAHQSMADLAWALGKESIYE